MSSLIKPYYLSLIFFLSFLSDDKLFGQMSRGLPFTESYHKKMLQGDLDWFKKELRRYPYFFSFNTGHEIRSQTRVLDAIKHEGEWFLTMGADTNSLKALYTLYTREKIVQLSEISFPERDIVLPMAVIADVYEDGIDYIRSYYCKSCIDSITKKQSPLFVYNPSLESVLPSQVYAYVAHSKYGRAEKMDDMLADSAKIIIQHGFPIQRDSMYRYLSLMIQDKGMKFEPTRMAFDGRMAALEWNLWRWGDSEMPKSSGLSLVEFNRRKEITRLIQFDQLEYPESLSHFIENQVEKTTEVEETIAEKIDTPINDPEQKTADNLHWYLLIAGVLLLWYLILSARSRKSKTKT